MKRIINGDQIIGFIYQLNIELTLINDDKFQNKLIINKSSIQSVFFDKQNLTITLEGANILEINCSSSDQKFRELETRFNNVFCYDRKG